MNRTSPESGAVVTEREAELLVVAAKAGIDSPTELANFMAQVIEESQGLAHTEERFRYRNSASIPVRSAHRHGEVALESARVAALHGKPEDLAELMYGGRNGNDQPGDGYTYRGRGYIQLTGKANYQAASDALGLELVQHPELAREPANAARVAIWYWQNNVPESARSDVRAATLAINGGYNGLEGRLQEFDRWKSRLTSEVVQHLVRGECILSIGVPSSHRSVGILAEGARGDSVRKLQASLRALGYTNEHGVPLEVDGDFGSGTRHALEAFQSKHDLAVDGKAGPQTAAELEQAQRLAEAARGEVLRLDDQRHPGHTLYAQALAAVHRLDALIGRAPDQRSANLAGALTVEARSHGMTGIDHVLLNDDGSKAFAIQGDPASDARNFGAGVVTAQAVNAPLASSTAAWTQQAQTTPEAGVAQSQIQQTLHAGEPSLSR